MGSSLFLTLFSGGGRYNVSSGRGERRDGGVSGPGAPVESVGRLSAAPDHGPAGGYPPAEGKAGPVRCRRGIVCRGGVPTGTWLAGASPVPGGCGSRHGADGVAAGVPSLATDGAVFSAGRRAGRSGAGTGAGLRLPWRHMWVGCIGQRSAGQCCWVQRWDFMRCCIWYSGRRPDMGEERSWTQPYPSEDRVVPCGCCTTRETPCEAPSPDSRCWCWSRRRWAGFCRRRWNES